MLVLLRGIRIGRRIIEAASDWSLKLPRMFFCCARWSCLIDGADVSGAVSENHGMRLFFLLRLFHDVLESRAEDDVLRVAGNRALILSPEERPVVEVLKMVGLAEKHTGSHIARYEREVGKVVPIEYLFRTGGSYCCNKRIVVVRMTSEKSVGGAIHFILCYDIGIIEMGKAYRSPEAEQLADSCPVSYADGHAIRILAVEVLDVLRIFLYIRTELVAVIFLHIGDGIECGLKVEL